MISRRGEVLRGTPPLSPRGLFVGVTSVDVVHLVDRVPEPNEKRPALDLLVTTGGPVTNAAVTFAWLGGAAHVVSALGRHPIADVARGELAAWDVRHTDLAPEHDGPPHTCSVMVTAETGERALVYRGFEPVDTFDITVADLLEDVDVLLVDGHQLPLSIALARRARDRGIPVVLDGGSWREGLDGLLAFVADAVCAETFRPPGCKSSEDALHYLADHGVRRRAVTRGPRPILYESAGGSGEVEVPVVERVVDTLGAGDIFHGAYCYYRISGGGGLRDSLVRAAVVAARSCTSFGPRSWMGPAPGVTTIAMEIGEAT
jgi:sugar/nucleoside kinase (ribokinase family)